MNVELCLLLLLHMLGQYWRGCSAVRRAVRREPCISTRCSMHGSMHSVLLLLPHGRKLRDCHIVTLSPHEGSLELVLLLESLQLHRILLMLMWHRMWLQRNLPGVALLWCSKLLGVPVE